MRNIVVGDAVYIKKMNVTTIFDVIYKNGPISRKELVERTQYSAATVTNHVKKLLDAGLVSETKEDSSCSGRKQTFLTVKPYSAYMVTVDISPQRFGVVLLNMKREIVTQKVVPITTRDYRFIIERIQLELEEILRSEKLSHNQIMGIGVSVPGIVDQHKGILEYAPTLGWVSLPIMEMLSERFGIPVLLENEAMATAIGQLEISYSNAQKLVYVGIDEKIGCGIVFRGDRIYGRSGEPGHMVVDKDGPECSCGRRGCWETLASETALLNAVNSELNMELTREEMLEMIKDRGLPVRPFEEVGYNIGHGLANVANILSPDVLVVGGSIIDFRENIEYAIRESFFQNTLSALRNRVTIEFSELNCESACIHGLCADVYENFLDKLIAEALS